MSSIVQFAGDGTVGVKVDEEPDAVVAAWRDSNGQPFRLSFFKGGDAWVNPGTIAYVVPAP